MKEGGREGGCIFMRRPKKHFNTKNTAKASNNKYANSSYPTRRWCCALLFHSLIFLFLLSFAPLIKNAVHTKDLPFFPFWLHYIFTYINLFLLPLPIILSPATATTTAAAAALPPLLSQPQPILLLLLHLLLPLLQLPLLPPSPSPPS